MDEMKPAGQAGLRHQSRHHLSRHIRQAEAAALEEICQPLVVHAQQVQHDVEHENDGEVGHKEQKYALHGIPVGVSMDKGGTTRSIMRLTGDNSRVVMR